jgi:dihydroceramidase
MDLDTNVDVGGRTALPILSLFVSNLANVDLAYYFIVWRLWLTRCLDGSEKDFMLKWSSPLTSIPQVVPRTSEKIKAKKTE